MAFIAAFRIIAIASVAVAEVPSGRAANKRTRRPKGAPGSKNKGSLQFAETVERTHGKSIGSLAVLLGVVTRDHPKNGAIVVRTALMVAG